MIDTTELIKLKGIGEKTSKLFAKLQLRTIDDLLHYYPRDYEKFEEPCFINNIKIGEINTIRVHILQGITSQRIRNLTVSTVIAGDHTGKIKLTFFNMPYLKNILKQGTAYLFRGRAEIKAGILFMEQPKLYKEEEYQEKLSTLQPVYSLTKGLSNKMITNAIRQGLSSGNSKTDFMPANLIEKYHLLKEEEALSAIHFPKSYESIAEGRRRLVFQEFLLFLIQLKRYKDTGCQSVNEAVMLETADTQRLIECLPFRLTNAQLRVWQEIEKDLAGKAVMNRLVQGDVGSGKTMIAFLALLACVVNGYQGAMMAPTEILARQHFDKLMSLTKEKDLPFQPVLLIGAMTAKEKKAAYEGIANGSYNVIVGTHALIQEKVIFSCLGLVITDEQHRFGVRQRTTLAGKGNQPHVLVMSATPIPRTLAIILYGDLDISVIDELPNNRLPIKNCVVNTQYREKAYQFMREQIKQGHQIYVICPMVEEGESEELENVTDYSKKLKEILPEPVRIAYLHGRLSAADKNKVMEDFASQNIDILVSTTVIEVGIDVPNATLMLIENAERFGLAQLHQLRGRIGRGGSQSYCIFMSGSGQKQTVERLEILNRSTDGFEIAREDMRLRGPGDLFGIRQSGIMEFQIADIFADAPLLQTVNEEVERILEEDSTLLLPDYFELGVYLDTQQRKFVDFHTL